MDSFLNITTVRNESADRNINELASVYENVEMLTAAIRVIVRTHLTDEIIKGRKILFKPNWVNHSVNTTDQFCLRTNDNFIIAALKAILEMGPSNVHIGDAPIQGCRWDKVVSEYFSEEVNRLSKEYNIPVIIIDFRRRKYIFSENSPSVAARPITDYIIFDLGKQSMLESITEPENTKFRVTNYDPDRMLSAHAPGVHKYCIAKDFFDADIVISLPKIKTHQKTGITGALKNIVGINGDKDFLPHHRMGGTSRGGDCYPGGSFLRYWAELALDKANRLQGKKYFWFWQKLSSLLWRLSFPGFEHSMAAGWHGNDTTWRMVLDLNRIAEYGLIDGTLSEIPQRHIFSLCDGIIGGQGDGPLEPDPLALGVISFTNNSAVNDNAMAILMGLPANKIPLLYNIPPKRKLCRISLNGREITLDDLKLYSQKAQPPRGWVKYFSQIQ
jgi:uncharacterized protein (DUF362 family)